MVINSTNNSIESINTLIQDTKIQNRIRPNRIRTNKIIAFPNRQILEQDVARANFDSVHTDKITADFTSRQYLALLLVAGSRSLHKARVLSSQA